MCGRYSLSSPGELLTEVFEVEESLQLEPRYNIAPTQEAPIVRARGDSRSLELARWGLIPSWANEASIGARTINARSETAAELRSFREPLKRRRCLVPADGFYEWQELGSGKQPFHLTRADRRPMAFAGLYDRWRDRDDSWIDSYAVLTTRPNTLLEPIHDRMPVILARQAWATWLDPSIDDPELLRPLFEPFPAEEMAAVPVDRFVNKVANDSPRCVREVEIVPEAQNLSLFV